MSMPRHGSAACPAHFCLATAILMLAHLGFASVDCAASEASPDTVTFANGDHVSGKFVEANHDTLTFAGTVTGTLSVQWSLVKKVELADEAAAVTSFAGKFNLPVSSIEVLGTEFLLTSRSGNTDKIPSANFMSVT